MKRQYISPKLELVDSVNILTISGDEWELPVIPGGGDDYELPVVPGN